MVNHPANVGKYNMGWGKSVDIKDDVLLNQICDYFAKRIEQDPISYNNSVWFENVNRQSRIIWALKNRDLDYLHEVLRNLFSSTLTHGTAQGDQHYSQLQNDSDMRENFAHVYFDKLITLSEMVGTIPMFSPEQYYYSDSFNSYFKMPPEELLDRIAEKYDFDILSPKYSGNLFGIETKYGLYNERDFMSLSVALKIADKFSDKNISICELGGGVGHLAYYLYKLGFQNLIIVDLPTISVSQMYFLSTNLGPDKVKLISPKEFTGNYDAVLNVDSMTEMNLNSAKEYCSVMKDKTKYFLSINHETNPFTVSSICTMKKISRHPFWLRKGYVFEEYINE